MQSLQDGVSKHEAFMSVEWASFCSMSNIVGEIIQLQNLIFPEFFALFLLVSARLLCSSHSRLPLPYYVDFCPPIFLLLCLPFCFKCWIKNRKLILMCFLIVPYSNHCLQENFFSAVKIFTICKTNHVYLFAPKFIWWSSVITPIVYHLLF